jgi:MFS family permease
VFLLTLSAVAGLAELAFVIVNISALPLFLGEGLGLPKLPGVAMGTFYLFEALGNSPMGALADRVGRRRMMVLGALLSVLTCLGTAHIRVPEASGAAIGWGVVALILLMRAFDGTGASMLWPSVFASVGDRCAPQRQAQAMTTINITYLVGIAIGPKVGGYVNGTFAGHLPLTDPQHYAPAFYVAAGCFLLTAVLAYLVAPGRRETTPHPVPAESLPPDPVGEHAPVSSSALVRAVQTVPMLMFLGALIFLSVGLIAPSVQTYFMKRFELTEDGFGSVLLAPAVLIGLVSLPLGRLSDTWGKTRSIRGGLALCALALWGILFAPSTSIALVIALGTTLGVGFVLAFPAYMAYIGDQAPAHERGALIGAVRLAQGIGALTGTLLNSLLYDRDARHMTVFVLSASLLTIALGLSMFFIRERRAPVA